MPVRFWRSENGYNIYVDTNTGVQRKVKLASEAQMNYINSLREQMGKKPLEGVLEAWRCTRRIDKYLERINKKTNQQKLL